MAWTYDVTDLNTTTASGRLNVVRFLLGDTDTLDQQVQDEEIVFSLGKNEDDPYGAASDLANAVAAKYSRLVTTELDNNLTVHYSDLSDKYKMLSSELSAQSKSKGAALSAAAGGLTSKASFWRGQFENTAENTVDSTWD